MILKRRTFLSKGFALAFLVGGLGRFLASCGQSTTTTAAPGGPTTLGGNCQVNGTSIAIQVVHTPNHTLTIPAADVTAGVQTTYVLADNGSGHTHQVTITAADFTNLKNNQGIQETSTLTSSHTHSVTVNCA
jgi:hypothetical protein